MHIPCKNEEIEITSVSAVVETTGYLQDCPEILNFTQNFIALQYQMEDIKNKMNN